MRNFRTVFAVKILGLAVLASLAINGVSAQIINTFAGSSLTTGFSGDGGPATAARFYYPSSVMSDGAGNIYVGDENNARIRLINSSGVISTIAGNGTPGYSGDGGAATAAELNYPSGVGKDASGNIYIADYLNARIRMINTSGIISTFAGTGTVGFSGDGGPATAARIGDAFDVTVDRSNNVYIADYTNNRIRMVNTSGTITTIAGNGTAGFSGDGGAATAAELSSPSSVAVDASGNIFITDVGNNRLRKVNPSGIISTIAGNGSTGFSGDGGAATAATLDGPYGCVYDAAGNIYFGDVYNQRVRKISASGIINTIAGNGTGGFSGDGGPATNAKLDWPYDVAIDGGGNIYMCDLYNNRIRMMIGCIRPVVPAITGDTVVCVGATITLADTASAGVWTSSDSTIASVNASTGVVTGVASGTLYITYSVTNSCGTTMVSTPILVNPLPTVGGISGAANVCLGNSITLTETSSGGTWSSVFPSVATVSSGGTVTTNTIGTDTITYSVTNSCGVATARHTVFVNTVPATITGVFSVCESGGVTALIETTTGGGWTSGSGSIATVDASGNVTGVSAGTATISYTMAVTGCYTTASVTVNPLPAAIGGPSTICMGATAVYTNTSAGGTWASSNGSIATFTSSTATSGTLSTSSNGTVTLTYTLATGCQATTSATVVTPPAAIAGPNSVCEDGSTITLSDSQPSGTWSSSNTAIASVNSVGMVTGATHGSVTISYSISGCPATFNLTVNALPGATITPVGDTMMCVGDFVTLTANTGTGYTYQWYDAAGAISGETNDYLLTTSGDRYHFRVVNANGCISLSVPMSVSVNPDSATLVPMGPTTFCNGLSVTLQANVGTGLNYQWLHNSVGISGAMAATYYATDSGDYQVIVSNRAGCMATSTPVAISLMPSPVNTITVSGPLAFCTGDSVVITGDTTSGLVYQWMDGGVNISGATNMTYVARLTGNYQLTETNSFFCSSNSAIASATEVAVPDASVTATGPTAFCAGGGVNLDGVAVSGNTYQWYKNGVAVSGSVASSYVASATGDYAVKVTTPAGCSNVTVPAIRAIEVTTPNITPYSSTSFCWGASVELGLDVSGATGVQYQWQRGGVNISGATGSNYTAQTSGDYSCVITLASGCVAASYAVTVTELPLPNPIVTFDGTFLSTGSYYNSYEWFRDLTPENGASSWKFHPTSTGDYTVKVIDSNGCQSTSTIFVLRSMNDPSLLGVNNVSVARINIYPNPTKGMLHIESSVTANAVIETIDGRWVFSQNQAKDLDISGLANGVYVLKLYSTDGVMLKAEKLVKE